MPRIIESNHAIHPSRFTAPLSTDRDESINTQEPVNIKYKLYQIMAELAHFYAEHTTLNRSLSHSTAKRLLSTNEAEVNSLVNHAFTKGFFALASGMAVGAGGFAGKEAKDFFKVCAEISNGLGSASDPLFNSWTSEVRALESHLKEIDLSGSKETVQEANQSLEKLFNMWISIQRNANHKG